MAGFNELDLLAMKYGTDKCGKHNYTPVYYDLFKDRKDTVRKVLEIGPAEGAGLFMFREFFPKATLYGAEIDQARVDKLQGLDRIKVYKCDQGSSVDLIVLLKNIGIDIDIVIDDGSHLPKDQVTTCMTLMTMLQKDVIYIIEDVADPTIMGTLDSFYDCSMFELGKRYDDRLIIVRHKS